MALLNYTSRVPAHQSIAEISRILAKSGAKKVMHEYDDQGYIVALTFSLEFEGQEIAFKLPSDWRPVQQILKDTRAKNSKLGTFMVEQDHALNVSWRIVKDWVEAQMALIETRMVTVTQVFLPYAVTKNGQTLYEHIASDPQLLLGAGQP